MEGFEPSTYGERFADIYDDWYPGDAEADAVCVERLLALADGRPILELAAGTGRIAVPLAERGGTVVALDNSPAMLDRLRAKAETAGVALTVFEGDMTQPPAAAGDGFGVVFVAYNSLFCLTGEGDQQACLAAAGARLAPGGSVVIEAFAPADQASPHQASPHQASPHQEGVTVRDLTADRVVLHVSRSDHDRQEARSQLVEITETGIRLRPIHLRWSTSTQLDAMAADAGLVLADRWADWSGAAFGPDSPTHISRYTRA